MNGSECDLGTSVRFHAVIATIACRSPIFGTGFISVCCIPLKILRFGTSGTVANRPTFEWIVLLFTRCVSLTNPHKVWYVGRIKILKVCGYRDTLQCRAVLEYK